MKLESKGIVVYLEKDVPILCPTSLASERLNTLVENGNFEPTFMQEAMWIIEIFYLEPAIEAKV